MYLDPRGLFMLAVLIGVAGYVVKGLMTTWYRLSHGERPAQKTTTDVEERLMRLEAATSSLLVDVQSMREKQRFMARLQATSSSAPELPAKQEQRKEGDLSPLVTQSIPVMPRTGSPYV
jgi:hypothetical protein